MFDKVCFINHYNSEDNTMLLSDSKDDILYVIKETACLEYISDLHDLKYRYKVFCAIKKICDTKFAIEEWQLAVNYILGDKTQFTNTSEARQYLLKKLKS